MAKRKTEAPVEQKVVDHADGKGMTINVNINGVKGVDDEGEAVQETGSPAPYDMEYGDPESMAPMPGQAPLEPDMQAASMVEGPDGEEMGDEDGGEGPPVDAEGEGPDGMEGEANEMGGEAGDDMGGEGEAEAGVDDMSGDDDEAVAADLASQYTEEQLIMALYQLAQGSQEMGEGMGTMGYSESEDSEGVVETETEADFGEAQSPDPLSLKVAELEEELAAQRRLMRQKEITDFCEKLYDGGKLTEQVAPISDLVRFMETLNAKNSVNFSETGKASQFDFMKNMLDNLPAMVSFNEVATPASAPKRPKAPRPGADGYVYDERNARIHAKAVEYAEQNNTDYMSALKLVIDDEA